MTMNIAKLASLVFLMGVAGVGALGCGTSQDPAPNEIVATESSALVTSGPACADGTIEDTFSGGLVGCSGAVTWDRRGNLCGGGYRPVTAAEWVANRGGGTPQHNYWTNDNLRYGGASYACSVSLTAGTACDANKPMRVCTPSGNDAEGNSCTWTNCGLDNVTPNSYFGGCNLNPTAGTLCIPTSCADGTVEETFTNGMVGCAGNVTWDNRRALCSAGYRPATAKEWATLGGVAPQHNYWTDDPLKWDGSGPSDCRVSVNAPFGCTPDTPMLVCTAAGNDPEGHGCSWTGCGLESNSPNKFFGGCPWTNSAGTLCVPEGCADSTIDQVFPNGMVGCGGSVNSSSAAASLCAPGYRLATGNERITLSHAEIRNSSTVALARDYWTQTGLQCAPGGCYQGLFGGALCVPQRGCADGTAEQVMPDGFVGCAGAATWADRDTLCGRGYRTATALEWRTLNSFSVQVSPTHNYWTADNLKYTGPATACSVSTTTGSACTAGRPMRLCTPSGSDAEGNTCGWTNCGLGTSTPNLFFGGCNTSPNAGALCVPDIPSADIVNQDPRLVSMLDSARSMFPETPGLAVAVVVDGKIFTAARGKRKATDTTDTLLLTDKFQQNSVSKTIAGTVSTRVVDQGSLSWDTTLGAAIPSIFPAPYPDYQNVTLAQLHAHASGFDYVTSTGGDNLYPNEPTTERKRLYTRDYTLDWPIFPSGTGFRYGTGAVPAISMVEQTLFQTPYDLLLQDFVFRPLMMKNSGATPDAWGHTITVDGSGNITVGTPQPPQVGDNHAKLPVGGNATSIEDIARYARATLYSPRHPVQYWSYRTQQSRVNNVGLSYMSPAGWGLGVGNQAGGLELSHNGWEGLNYSFVTVWPERRIAFMGMTNCAQVGGGSNGRALDWLWDQFVNQGKLTEFGVPSATFPHPDAATRPPNYVVGTSSSNKPGDEADKALDGDYNTYWAAEDWNGYGAWLQVTVPEQPYVGHVLVNENGPFDKMYFDTDFWAWFPVLARGGAPVVAFRITSYELYLTDSSGTEWLAATGTTLGVNKLIPVNGYNVTGARLVMNTAFGAPVIKEMHLLPW